jgi:ribonuclease-3
VAAPRKVDHDALARQLGYSFHDGSILSRALTHGSALAENHAAASYQRLEFLGDRVLGLVIADMLIEAYPKADEGALARRFNALVRRETCADVAKALDLGRHILLGAGESRSGGRQKKAILADVCEAVIAAIFRDGGFDEARAFIDRNWRDRMMIADRPRRDAKTKLQEWAQGRGLGLPLYEVVAQSGPDHAPLFTVLVTVEGLEPVAAEGRSRRAGEQAAAAACLTALGEWQEEENTNG